MSQQDDDFAEELRKTTMGAHRSSRTAVNLTAPVALSSRKVYRLLLASFYHVFKALEEELEHRRRLHPKIGRLYFRELLRTRAFEADLAFYFADDYPARLPSPTPVTLAYVEELHRVVAEDPVMLIAYCSTMYLAMMGGGRILKKWLKIAFGVEKEGAAVFDFSDTISDAGAFKERYKEALNTIALTREEKDRIILRKKRIFESNNAIFTELRMSAPYKTRVATVLLSIVALIFVVLFAFYGVQNYRVWASSVSAMAGSDLR